MRALWEHVCGEQDGVLALFSGVRAEPGSKKLEDTCSVYFDYPRQIERAEAWCSRQSAEEHEVYFCAHLLTRQRRIKKNAAPLVSLYVDGDGAQVEEGMPRPSAVVESSPGREQFYFRLTKSVLPHVGERLNRRLALAMGADDSGWDLTQLLRPPETRNYKYPDAPVVRLIEINDVQHDPEELGRMLPPEPDDRPKEHHYVRRPAEAGDVVDLSPLSQRMQDLVRHGNRGEYPCRSRADMAACIAMFGAGFSRADVWAVMTDPANGISGKFLDKGRSGERYLALTIGKAEARAQASRILVGKSKARRIWSGVA